MLRIGDFSKLSRISIRMLRHYDEIGLLVPKDVDDFTGYRYYSEAQLPLANRIHSFKEMGFGLSTIKEILQSYNEPVLLREFLLEKQKELREQRDKTSIQLRILENRLERIGKDDIVMEYNVVLKDLPQRYVASLRNTIESYDKEGILWGQMMGEMGPQNVKYANSCYSMALFHDPEYKEKDPDVEVQIAVQGNYDNTEHVIFKTVQSNLVASATYKGSYEQFGAVNAAIANWIKENGYEYNGIMCAIYHVGPAQTQNPNEFVTEVCFPVKKK